MATIVTNVKGNNRTV